MAVVELVTVGVGLALALFGAFLFRTALRTFGGLLGAVLGAQAASGGDALGGLVFGAIVGVIAVETLYTLVVVGPGFLAGFVLGFGVFQSLELALVAGLVGAGVAWMLESVMLVVSTAFVGGVVTSTALATTGGAGLTVQSLQLFGVPTLVVTAVGIVSQVSTSAWGGGDENDDEATASRPALSVWSLVPTAGRARESAEVLLERREGTFSDRGFEPRD